MIPLMFKLAIPILLAIARTFWISFRAVVTAPTGRLTRERADRWLVQWSRALLKDVDAEVEVVGAEHLEPHGPIVVMSNHQSLYDIPVIFDVMPMSLRMVAKMELFKIPLWGQAMRAAGFISVDRGNREKAIRSLAEARRRIEEGIAVWIAPEGTRSADGQVAEFKRGGFVLARDLGVPILPVTIDGTRDILPARTFQFVHGVKIRVTIHPRVHTDQGIERDELIAQVRRTIASGLVSSPALVKG